MIGREERETLARGRNTMPQPIPDVTAKRRAQHYSRWFLPTAQLSLDEYERQHAMHTERMGGEQSRIQRELREKQRDLDQSLAGPANTRTLAIHFTHARTPAHSHVLRTASRRLTVRLGARTRLSFPSQFFFSSLTRLL